MPERPINCCFGDQDGQSLNITGFGIKCLSSPTWSQTWMRSSKKRSSALEKNDWEVIKMHKRTTIGFVLSVLIGLSLGAEDSATLNQKADGYRGVWYQNGKLNNEFGFKYSGGLGTYCAKHKPLAVYCPTVQKTFFCYGGVNEGYHETFQLGEKNIDKVKTTGALHHLVAYFDHKTGKLSEPTILLDKQTHDAHDNPVISVDDQGYVWILSTAHGSTRPAYVHKSNKPYNVDAFTRVQPYRTINQKKTPITNFSYMQAWIVPARGFVFFFTKYDAGNRRETCFATSADGRQWTNWTQLADIEAGHYQISAANANKAVSAFNYHPFAFNGDRKRKGLNWRTNLYYLESRDLGKTWRAADGTVIKPPVTKARNPALIRDFEKENKLVYLKDVVLDEQDRPIILFITSSGFEPGPKSGPRTWNLARWTGLKWEIHAITTSDSNYDMGSLYLEPNNTLRVIAPTESGPQAGNPGGEIAMWISKDGGKTWHLQKQLTKKSTYNNGYVRRPVNASPDFYAFWADGHGREPSASRLYYCNQNGQVFQMPTKLNHTSKIPPKP